MRLGRTRTLVLVAVLAAAALGIAACGGGGDGDGGGGASSDEDQIKDTITELATSRDVSVCTNLATDNYLQQVYGTEAFQQLYGDDPQAACEQNVEDQTETPELDFGSIDVNGDSATAELTVSGGTFAGRSATFNMVKEGSAWKVDGIEGG